MNFGSVFGSFSDPFWSISASFSRTFLASIFARFLGSVLEQNWIRNGYQNESLFDQIGQHFRDGSRNMPWIRFWGIFCRFWTHFGSILGYFLLRFGALGRRLDLSDLCGSLLARFPSFCLRFPLNRISFFLSLFFFQEPRRTANRCPSEARKRAKRAQRAKRWQDTARSNGRRHGYYLSVRSSRSNARLNPLVSDSLSLFAG